MTNEMGKVIINYQQEVVEYSNERHEAQVNALH
jgi:hypothetical protein